MAAVSAWAKPGAWALDSEENEASMEKDKGYSSSDSAAAAIAADFPSLSAAKATKKQKKKTTMSLAEFASGAAEKKFHPSSRSVAADETLVLPTGPRERSAEELERPRGFGYSSYGPRGGGGGGDRESRREPRDLGPSRADEVDDWGSTKRSVVPERRERGGGGFFDSPHSSRADESDSWISRKPVAPSAPPRSSGRFELFNREGSNGSGVDSDTWGRKREETGGRADSDTWGKKREETGGGGRPKLMLQPRSLPVVNGSNGDSPAVSGKGKGTNPFGEARPREEVLKEKGKDWKEIDEKLETMRVQEVPPIERKGSSGPRDNRTERAWRKPDGAVTAVAPPSESCNDELVESVVLVGLAHHGDVHAPELKGTLFAQLG